MPLATSGGNFTGYPLESSTSDKEFLSYIRESDGMTYVPEPLDTSAVKLAPELLDLTEQLARHAHAVWARQRLADGWTLGPQRDDVTRQHPCLVPYEELSESEKQYDRNAALETLAAIAVLGYELVRPAQPAPAHPSPAMPQSLVSLLDQLKNAENSPQELATLQAVWTARRDDDPTWTCSPEPYRRLARRFLKVGSPRLASEVVRAALEFSGGSQELPCWAEDVELRQIQALAWARSGEPQLANEALTRLKAEGQTDEETLGLLARTHKDLALSAAAESQQREHFTKAYQSYSEAYRRVGGCWTGINASSMATLLGHDEQAAELALQVRQQCLSELAQAKAAGSDPYWLLATMGEIALNLRDRAAAADWFTQAWQAASKRFGDLHSTRTNALLLLDRLGWDRQLVDRWLPLPRVAVFTGHMVDRPGRASERFPPRHEQAVYQALLDWLREHNALIGFASAACGSDILFLEALRELEGEAHIVLPYHRDDFLQDSVAIAPEGNWTERFNRLLAEPTQVITVSPQKVQQHGVSYDYANLVLHGLATVRATQLRTELLGLAVWDGQQGDGPGGTATVIRRWHKLQVPVHRVDPLSASHSACRLKVRQELARDLADSVPAADSSSETPVMAMLFADAVNFSKLSEEQVPRFVQHFLGPIAEMLNGWGDANVVRNTWGDGLYLVFHRVRDAGCFALEMCEWVVGVDWEKFGLPPTMNLRVALHAGPVFRCIDPVTGQLNYTGTHVSRAARLEPKTPPGQVYASEAFAALAAVEQVSEFRCEYVKQLEWAKHYGSFPAYVLRN